jgi:hypothetical protein
MCSSGLLLFSGLIAWATPSALAQSSPQDTTREDVRPKREDTGNLSTNTKRDIVPASNDTAENQLGLQLFKNIARDQRDIWTSPAHVRLGHATWLVPFAGVTAGLIVTDRDTSLHLSNDPNTFRNYRNFSNYGAAGMAGGVGGLYLWGRATNDPHKQEAGILSGEAALDALLVWTALKYATGRERPGANAYHGKFWQGGDSFPSSHAAGAWAVASVLAHEYPGPLTKIFAYGAATAISVARIQGKQHFPSDVLVGSGIGWLTGWQVYRAHHKADVGGGVTEDLSDSPIVETERMPSAMGSPYVPLDSWIYPLFDRLVAMGAMNDAILGIRPWTRLECARLVNEAGEPLQDAGAQTESSRLYDSLRQEFAPELNLLGGGSNRAIRLESVYTRFTGISGPPLTDGYHFGQTLFNDFGRPFQEGFNAIAGFSGWATAGRWVVYVRGEYQCAPSGPAIPVAAANAIAAIDITPLVAPSPTPARSQARLLDTYVGLNLGNWQLSSVSRANGRGPGRAGRCYSAIMHTPCRCFTSTVYLRFGFPGLSGFSGPYAGMLTSAGSRGICSHPILFSMARKSVSNPLAISSLDSRARWWAARAVL